jgi:hypothetical protein
LRQGVLRVPQLRLRGAVHEIRVAQVREEVAAGDLAEGPGDETGAVKADLAGAVRGRSAAGTAIPDICLFCWLVVLTSQ